MSSSFVWPLQACRIGVLLREGDRAQAVTARKGAGSSGEAVGAAWGTAESMEGETAAARVDLLAIFLPRFLFSSLPEGQVRLSGKADSFRTEEFRMSGCFSFLKWHHSMPRAWYVCPSLLFLSCMPNVSLANADRS